MTKPRREPGAARQWGVVNAILKSSSQSPHSSPLTRRSDESHDLKNGRRTSRLNNETVLPPHENQHNDRLRLSQPRSRNIQNNFHHQEQRHCAQPPQQSRATHSNGRPDQSFFRFEGRRNDQRRSLSLQKEHRRDGLLVHGDATKLVELLETPSTLSGATTQDTKLEVRPSSRKRKRTITDNSSSARCIRATKKQEISRFSIERSQQALPCIHDDPKSVASNSATATTARIVEGQLTRELKTPAQPTTSPSNRLTLDCGGFGGKASERSRISTPISIDKSHRERDLSLLVSTGPAKSMKSQRDEGLHNHKAPEQLPQLNAPVLGTPRKTLPTATVHSLQEPHSDLHVQGVESNPSIPPLDSGRMAKLRFIEDPHDCIPILCSSVISRGSDANSLGLLSGTLVVDALAIIGPSINPHAKCGWPSTIELPGRAQSQSQPTRIIKDIDLYLCKKESGLCVVTEHGLVTVTSYLKLIGVPREQPVRIEGCIPTWARATFRTPERRRIMVPLNGADPRKFELVPRDTALGTHQISLALNSRTKVKGKLQELEGWQGQASIYAGSDAQRQLSAESPTQGIMGRQAEDACSEPQSERVPILSADPGHLPLRAGSIVLVYAIDDEDHWAYGRLSGTDKMGRFPIQHTCPIDWSLDRFARTNDNLTLTLPYSKDPAERNWGGLYHWLRQGGYAFGPTWKETLEAGAARARYEKARNMAAMELSRISDSNAAEVVNAPAKRSAYEVPLSDERLSGSMTTALEKTMSITIKSEVSATTPVLSNLSMDKEAEMTQLGRDQTEVPDGSERSAKGVSGTQVQKAGLLGPVQIKQVDEPASSSASEQQDIVSAVVNCPESDVKSNCTGDGDAAEFTDIFPVQGHVTASHGPMASIDEPFEANGRRIYVNDTGEDDKASESESGFAKWRHSMFARNDDIEYDWGEEEL